MPSIYGTHDLPEYTDLFGTHEVPYFPDLPVVEVEPVSSKLHSKDPTIRDAELKARRRVQFWNLLQTGFAFMFLLSSVQTALSVGVNIQENVLLFMRMLMLHAFRH